MVSRYVSLYCFSHVVCAARPRRTSAAASPFLPCSDPLVALCYMIYRLPRTSACVCFPSRAHAPASCLISATPWCACMRHCTCGLDTEFEASCLTNSLTAVEGGEMAKVAALWRRHLSNLALLRRSHLAPLLQLSQQAPVQGVGLQQMTVWQVARAVSLNWHWPRVRVSPSFTGRSRRVVAEQYRHGIALNKTALDAHLDSPHLFIVT